MGLGFGGAGGGVAAIANGVPLWVQDSEWSQRLRGFLEQWLGQPARFSCGTDTESRRRYRDALAAAGFTDVQETIVEYTDELDLDQLVSGLYSAMPANRLPAPAVVPIDRSTQLGYRNTSDEVGDCARHATPR